MGIVRAHLAPLRLTLRAPLRTARASYAGREGWLLSLRDGEGSVGVGEAMPLVAFGTEPLEAAEAALRAGAEGLQGAEIPSTADEVDALVDGLGLKPGVRAARHALEQALLDLAARRARLPLSRFLDPAARDAVEVNALLGAQDPAALAAEAREAVAAGYAVLKVKVAVADLETDRTRLAAVRDAVGEGVRLRIDANGGWSEGEAARALRALSAQGLELCEQPVAAEDVEALRRLRGLGLCPIAADEALTPPGGVDRVLAGEPAADLLVLRPMVLGGLVRALRLGRRAAGCGLSSFVASSLDGAVARAGAAHLAAALPPGGPASGLGVGALFEGDPRGEAYLPRRGRIALSGPGLGLAREAGA